MNISGTSFWQQDQNWQLQQQSWDQQLSNADSLTSVLTTALTDQTTGLASIANNEALNRVTSQFNSALTSAAGPSANAASSTSSSSASGGSSASGASTSSTQTQPVDNVPTSSAVDLQSTATAASLLAGELPVGSLLSILACPIGHSAVPPFGSTPPRTLR
jgi:hypothetical protein